MVFLFLADKYWNNILKQVTIHNNLTILFYVSYVV